MLTKNPKPKTNQNPMKNQKLQQNSKEPNPTFTFVIKRWMKNIEISFLHIILLRQLLTWNWYILWPHTLHILIIWFNFFSQLHFGVSVERFILHLLWHFHYLSLIPKSVYFATLVYNLSVIAWWLKKTKPKPEEKPLCSNLVFIQYCETMMKDHFFLFSQLIFICHN